MSSGPSIPRSQRKRPTINLSLDPEAHRVLKALARGEASALVSELVLDDAHARQLLREYAAEHVPVRDFLGLSSEE